MHKLRVAAVAVLLGLLLAGCGGMRLHDPGWGGEQARSIVDGNNAFAFDLYAQLRKDPGNLIFSPFSISTALAMTYAGACGETERQMREVLHFPQSQSELHPVLASTVGDVLRRAAHAGVELSIANSVWVERDLALLDGFVDLLRRFYDLEPGRLDFGDLEGARSAINAWAERRTRGRIRDVVPPGGLGRLPVLVLANAIYFKAVWQRSFDERSTYDSPFYISLEDHTGVRMMSQTATFGYAEDEECQILSMPYRGGDFDMVVILPRRRDGLGELEARMDAAWVNARILALVRQTVAVFFPRFTLTRYVPLESALRAMGMADAFDDRSADFSGMTGGKALFVSNVLHKAFVEANEEGTEAAAATVVVVKAPSMDGRARKMPPVFCADHPFVFMIRDNRSGSILFMGRVADPTRIPGTAGSAGSGDCPAPLRTSLVTFEDHQVVDDHPQGHLPVDGEGLPGPEGRAQVPLHHREYGLDLPALAVPSPREPLLEPTPPSAPGCAGASVPAFLPARRSSLTPSAGARPAAHLLLWGCT